MTTPYERVAEAARAYVGVMYEQPPDHGFTAPQPDPDRHTPLFRRLTAEARDNGEHMRTVAQAQADYRDAGSPMFCWLTGRDGRSL